MGTVGLAARDAARLAVRRLERPRGLDQPEQLAVGGQDETRLALERFLVDLEGAGKVIELARFADCFRVSVDDLGVDAAGENIRLLLALALDLFRLSVRFVDYL